MIEQVLNSGGVADDALRVVPEANFGTDDDNEGLVVSVGASLSEVWSIVNGAVLVGRASGGSFGVVDAIWDDWEGHKAKNGGLPLPAVPRAVRTVSGDVVKLEDLADPVDGSWQAATVAQCTLASGEVISLRVHMRGKYTMCFELVNGTGYGS